MKNRNWFWGAFFIIAAVLIVAMQFNSFITIGFWSVVATVFLAAILIKSLADLNLAGIPVPLALLYLIYQKPLAWPVVNFWVLIGAAVLASIGLGFLFGNLRRRRYYKQHAYGRGQMSAYASRNGNAYVESEENNDDNHPFAKVRLGAASKYLHSTCLEDGHFESNLGALEVYFDQATLSPNGADIYLDCSLGAISLYIPHGWIVEENISAAIGGVDNKRHSFPAPGAPVLRLHGNVSLGGIEIKYV